MIKNRKGQSGLVIGIFFGIIAIILTTIVGFTIIQSLNDASILTSVEPTNAFTQTNETFAWVENTTAYTLDEAPTGVDGNSSNSGFLLTDVWYDLGGYTEQLNASWLDRLSLTTDTGLLTNTSSLGNGTAFQNISVSYTYNTITGSLPSLTTASNNLSTNLSSGIDEVSKKVPTILKIAIVVLLIGVLVLLTLQARRMGLFEGGGGGL